MRIDWRTDRNAPQCRVINCDTNEQILFCAMADEEAGEYEQYRVEEVDPSEVRVIDSYGDQVKCDGPCFKWICDENGRLQIDKFKARIRIEVLNPGEPYLLPVPNLVVNSQSSSAKI